MSAKARAYTRWQRWRDAARRAGDAVHAGLWLGLLDRADLHAVDQDEYRRRTAYRSDAYNLSGLFEWERRMIDRHFPAAGPVVVLGAGGGREVLALAGRGHRVAGYECHPLLVEAGRDLLRRTGSGEATLDRLGRDRAPSGGGPYAAAVVGWSAYMLMAGRGSRMSFLAGLHAVLVPDAPVLLSFAARSAGERRPAVVAAVAGPVRRLRRRPPVELGDDLAPNFLHRFTEEELAEELTGAGYTPVDYAPGRAVTGEPGHAVARRC
ncbi:hypothetical protein [Pseudosporangium ferrugineum]|uniref:Methyltransferase family protein n=1 Tax=Pseudosporangium ferrugineum TaxID=439699 RepID=A0A2T0SAN1_9ACTN|nr:hypothetical protein [Pseudosporangium ferrugineum]PRY30479.1 hypothetical protein CLV70_10431 [Pseudosporangium ferrugineum]